MMSQRQGTILKTGPGAFFETENSTFLGGIQYCLAVVKGAKQYGSYVLNGNKLVPLGKKGERTAVNFL